jgi:predicted phage gp36 major capsid-like protein
MNTVRELNKDTELDELVDSTPTVAVEEPEKIPGRISKAQVKRVIGLIEQGMSERGACREVGIHASSFRSAVARIGAIEQYARATAALAEQQINLMENVLEKLEKGLISPEQARIMIDARKWFASKLLPKKYGDKVEHEGNVNVIFSNGIPRPKYIEGEKVKVDAISSVPVLPKGNKGTSQQG